MIAVYLAHTSLPGIHPVYIALSCFALVMALGTVTRKPFTPIQRAVIAAVILAVALSTVSWAAEMQNYCSKVEPWSFWWTAWGCYLY